MHVDCQGKPGAGHPLTRSSIDHHDVDLRVINLDDVERMRRGELTRHCLRTGQSHPVFSLARMQLGIDAAHSGVDGPPGRRCQALLVAAQTNALDQIRQSGTLWLQVEVCDCVGDDRLTPLVKRTRAARASERRGEKRGCLLQRAVSSKQTVYGSSTDAQLGCRRRYLVGSCLRVTGSRTQKPTNNASAVLRDLPFLIVVRAMFSVFGHECACNVAWNSVSHFRQIDKVSSQIIGSHEMRDGA